MGLLLDLSFLQKPEPLDCDPVPWTTPAIPGRILAGLPSPAAEVDANGLNIKRYLIHNHNATFIFTVVDD